MAERSPSTAPRGWRGGATTRPSPGRSPISRRAAAVGLVLALLAGLGTVGWLISSHWPRPSPRFLALWVADYRDPRIPTDPSSARDYQALAGVIDLPAKPPGLGWEWKEALARSGANRGVIVYLSAHARLGPKGEVRILGADAQFGHPEREPALRDVLAALKACPAPDKLLILDIMRPHADPTLGVLDDDVAGAVVRELEGVPDEVRTVLGAASAGQTSRASETLGRSVFNYYAEQGLRGEADATAPDPDGIVTVAELAEYVKARTAAWARRNRDARQVPLLIAGRGGETRILQPDSKGLKPQLDLPDEDEKTRPAYPPWLVDAWKRRGAWWDDGSYRVAPRLFRRLEAALLRAERQWRMGADPQRVREGLRSEFPTLMKEGLAAGPIPSLPQLEPRFRPAGPETPRSIGLAEGLGRGPDPALVEPVLAWLMQLRNPPPDAKAEAPAGPAAAANEFLAANKEAIQKDASGLALAWAVLEAAATPPNGDLPDLPERLRLLAPLIERRPRPLKENFIEMLLLADLAARGGAAEPSAWSAATLQQAVSVLRVAERVDGRPDTFPWVRHLLDRAGHERHVAEILLRSPGFAPEAEVRASLDRAGHFYDELVAAQRTIAETRRRLDEALAVLPPYLAYREATRGPARTSDTWSEAVAEARRGFALLEQPPEELAGRVGDLQQVAARLAGLLDEMRRPFGKEAVDDLIARARREGEPETLVEIEAVLTAPFPAPEDRVRLWDAGRGLGRRLHEGPDGAPDEGTDESVAGVDRRVAERARWSLELLALGGMEGDELAKPYADYESKPGPATEAALVRAVQEAWIARLPERLDQAFATDGPGRLRSLRAADRLGRIVPPAQGSKVLDSPDTNPAVRSAAAEAVEFWGWLARRYRYEARVLGGLIAGTRLFGDAADACDRLAADRTPEPTLRLDRPGAEVPTLDAERPSVEATVRLTLEAPDDAGGEEAELRVLSPDARLQVEPREWVQALKPRVPAPATLKLTFREGEAAGRPSRTEGVLVLATLRGRPFPLTIPVGEGLGTSAPVLIVGASPKAPGPPLREILVRPLMAPQKFFLHVHNPSDRPREVTIQVLAGGVPVPGGTATVSIGPGKTGRVTAFGDPAAPAAAGAVPPGGADAARPGPPADPEAGMIELADSAPISFRMSFDGKPPIEKSFPVRLAGPADYLEVVDQRFEPAGAAGDGKNKLSVQVKARDPVLDPPAEVHLVVSREGIPGLQVVPKQAEDRVRVGGKPGEVKRVFAGDLRLDGGAKAHGVFYLDVDHFDRAMKFGVNFLPDGPPQTPREDDVPAIRRMRAGADPFPDAAPLPVLAGEPLPVVVEVDNAPPGSTLELSLGAPQGIDVAPRTVTGGAKRRYLGLAVDPAGSLVFKGSVRDREFDVETAGLQGSRRLTARLLGTDGAQLDAMTREVVFDDRPPDRLRFLNLPAGPIVPGTKALDLQAEGSAPSGIRSVAFFLGEPQDGKRPEDAKPIPARPLNDGRTRWGATVPLPAAPEPGRQAISVEFTSEVKKVAIRTGFLEFPAPPPPPVPPVDTAKQGAPKKDEPTTGTITGTLREGTRPQRQVDVVLVETDPQDKAKEKSRVAKTDAAGKFTFKDVRPGKCLVSASKPASRTRARQVVEVEAGEVVTVDLMLMR